MPREPLPNRRQSQTLKLEHGGQTFHVTAGYRLDGRLAEIFITAPKASETYAAVQASDGAVAVSLALQYGCPPEVLRSAFLRTADGSAAGVLAKVFDLLGEIGNDTT